MLLTFKTIQLTRLFILDHLIFNLMKKLGENIPFSMSIILNILGDSKEPTTKENLNQNILVNQCPMIGLE